MAQSAARKSHNLKVVSSILTCRMLCISDSDKLESQLNNQIKTVSRWFSDNAKRQWRSRQRVSFKILRSWVRSSLVECFFSYWYELQSQFYNQIKTLPRWLSDDAKRQWCSQQRVSPIILKSWVRSSLVSYFVFPIETNYKQNGTTIAKLYLDDSPIMPSDNGAVGSA